MTPEPGDYETELKYAFTETIDAWLEKYKKTQKTKYILTILSIEFDEQRKFVTLPFDNKKEALKIYKEAQNLFKHESIKGAAFSLSQVIESKVYESSNSH